MKLYHGSYLTVEKPDISYSRTELDFGRGFYVTPIKEQAFSWARRFKRSHGQSVVTTYEFDEADLERASILNFTNYSMDWLDFIISCRQGGSNENYDIVIGGVANDKVFDTIQLYLDHLIDKEESLKRLKFEKPNLQYCFCNQEIIDKTLRFLSSEVL